MVPSQSSKPLHLACWVPRVRTKGLGIASESVSEVSLPEPEHPELESPVVDRLFGIFGEGTYSAWVSLAEEDGHLRQNLRWLSGPFRLFANYCWHLGHSQSVDRELPEAIR